MAGVQLHQDWPYGDDGPAGDVQPCGQGWAGLGLCEVQGRLIVSETIVVPTGLWTVFQN